MWVLHTVITNNGSKTEYGGGIQNYGEIIISADAQLYNNHAKIAGDDIYNTTGDGIYQKRVLPTNRFAHLLHLSAKTGYWTAATTRSSAGITTARKSAGGR